MMVCEQLTLHPYMQRHKHVTIPHLGGSETVKRTQRSQ